MKQFIIINKDNAGLEKPANKLLKMKKLLYKKTFVSFLGFLVLSNLMLAQGIQMKGSGKKQNTLNASAEKYIIGGMQVTGTKYFDEDLLLTVSGLQIGDKVSIETDEKITKAILNLWKQNFFSKVSISVDKIINDKVFLNIELEERPRLGKYNFKGIKSGEATDLKDKVNLISNKVLSESAKVNAVENIRKYFYEKAYLNPMVTIEEKVDTSTINTVILTFNINKGTKSKINQVNISGNENVNYLKLKSQMKGTKEMARLSLYPIESNSVFSNIEANSTKDYVANKGFLSLSKTLTMLDPYFRYKFLSASKYNKKKFEEDKDKIVSYYNGLGYRDASIAADSVYTAKTGNLNVDLKIAEGHKYYFGDITWKGNTKYADSTLQKLLGIKKGDLFNQSLLDRRLGRTPGPEGTEDITSLYMDDGYLYFNVDPRESSIIGDTISYEVVMTEGAQAIIGKIIITGNDKTHENVIRRELRTFPGAKFSRTDLMRSQREIANLGFFDAEKIGIQPKPQPDGTVDIEYTVVEKSSDQLELQAGFGGALGITGTLGLGFNNFSLKNILNKKAYDPLPVGDGQKLNIRAQANGKWYNSENFSFTEPWLGGKKPTSLQLSFYRTFFSSLQYGSAGKAADTSMTTYGMGANIIKRIKWPDDFFVLTYGLNYQQYRLRNYSQFSSILGFDNGISNNVFLKLALSRYSIDQPLYPRSGSNINLTASFTPPFSLLNNKDYNDISNKERYKWIEYHKYRFTAEWYHPIKGNLVFKIAAKHGYLGQYSKHVTSPFERFQLGGNGLTGFTVFGKDIISQRGYENVYQDNAIIFNKYTMELRYPFSLNPSSTIYGIAFADAANAWNTYKSFNPFKLNRDAGLGVRIFLPMFGMLGLDYGIRFDRTVRNDIGSKLGQRAYLSFMLGQEPD
jgi:outer membrane protein insertion porin family